MIAILSGTIINVAAIVAGGLAGLLTRRELSAHRQRQLRILLGAFLMFIGSAVVWHGLGGSVRAILGQVLIIAVALMLGRWLGDWVPLQRWHNRLGQWARERIGQSQSQAPRFSDGFLPCAVLFCAEPLAVLGSLQNGLQADWRVLLIKAIMDAMATFALVRSLGAGVLASALPVLAYQGTWTLLAQGLANSETTAAIAASLYVLSGVLTIFVSLVVLQVQRVELAKYWTSLPVVAVLAWWFWPK